MGSYFLAIRCSGARMLSREEVAKIRAEIERLEKAREDCNDGGIRKSIDSWIEEQKEKLISEISQSSDDPSDQF